MSTPNATSNRACKPTLYQGRFEHAQDLRQPSVNGVLEGVQCNGKIGNEDTAPLEMNEILPLHHLHQNQLKQREKNINLHLKWCYLNYPKEISE